MVTMTVPPEGEKSNVIIGNVAKKPLLRFESLAGSLETLISQMALDWENAAVAHTGSSSSDMDAARAKGGKLVNKPVDVQIRKAQLLFTELHATTRKIHNAIEGFRKKVSASKQSMDLNHLQLQNLLYERDHLSRETQLCKDFTMTELSKMEDSEEQGVLEDVDMLQTKEEHAKNLNILKDQKDKRINAQRELGELQIRVKAANSAVGESKQYLMKLPDYLKDVEKALVPLRKNMPWRPGARRGRHEQAVDLPGPLFTLFCQLEAYCDSVQLEESEADGSTTGASSLVAEYEGVGGSDSPPHVASVSITPARTYVSGAAKAAAESTEEIVKSNGRTSPSPGHDGSAAKRQKRHHRGEDGSDASGGSDNAHRTSRREAGRAILDALKPSPNEVLLTLTKIANDDTSGEGGSHAASKGKSNGGIQFTLRFSYIPALGIVAVCPPPNYPSSLLANLFPNDTGRDTPNPTNHHGRAARASPLGVFEYPGDVPCRPYRWAQWLSGLHFPPPAFSFEATAGSGEGAGGSRKAIEPSVSAVVAELRSRVRTQWALASQLKAIGDKGPVCLAEFHDKLPLGKASANNVELRSWKELSGTELQQAAKSFQTSSTQGSVEKNEPQASPQAGLALMSMTGPLTAVDVRDQWEQYGSRYFRGVVKMKRGHKKEADVDLLVEVPAEYPVRPSRLSLKAKTAPPDDAGSQDLRTIANEVNAHYDTLLTEDVRCWDHLLSHQIMLVMSCLGTPSVDGFTGRLRRGRMRRKPVLFDRLQKTFVHR